MQSTGLISSKGRVIIGSGIPEEELQSENTFKIHRNHN